MRLKKKRKRVKMQVKILFNSGSIEESLSIGWGVSFLIGDSVLFDTGEKGPSLLNNTKEMKIDLSLIQDVVISHDHWDHTGGLWDILKQRQDINVYACPGFSNEFKRKVESSNNHLVENRDFMEISKDIYVTGEIRGEYQGGDIFEQAVVVDGDKGLTVITGCAHPGIVKILDLVRKEFPARPFYAVFGGFHLMNQHPRNIHSIIDVFKDLGVKKAGPTHCSGTEAENVFREEYGNNFISTKIGEAVSI